MSGAHDRHALLCPSYDLLWPSTAAAFDLTVGWDENAVERVIRRVRKDVLDGLTGQGGVDVLQTGQQVHHQGGGGGGIRAAPDHVHHERARRYWEVEATDQLAFCRVTLLALLRHLTNPHIMRHAVQTCRAAWETVNRWLKLPEVVILRDPTGVDDALGRLSQTVDLGPALWTDAYLTAFAMAGSHRLVTFDKDFRRFPGLHLLLLSP